MLGWRLRGDSSEPLIAPPSSSAVSLNGASNSSLIDAARAGSPPVLQDQTAKPSVQSLATGSDIIISKRSRARAGSSSPLEPTRRAAALSSQESRQHHPDRAHCMTCLMPILASADWFKCKKAKHHFHSSCRNKKAGCPACTTCMKCNQKWGRLSANIYTCKGDFGCGAEFHQGCCTLDDDTCPVCLIAFALH